MSAPTLTFRVYPDREYANGNILWAERDRGSEYYPVSRFVNGRGRFTPDHPAAPDAATRGNARAEVAESPSLQAFRARGYWASCFPEGDGITWRPERGQTDAQCLADIRECFGWDAQWAPNVKVSA